MNKRRIAILILVIVLVITVSIQSVLGASSTVNRPARVDNTYDWGAGIYGMNAEKKQFITVNGVKNISVDYDEISYSNQEIEPSVGYAYYVAKTAGLNDADMQSVIYMSDRWGNTSNVKNKGSKQEVQGKGTIYQRATQYGTVYYGILQDAIKNNKKVIRIKDEENVKKNIKVLVDQDSGTYTVGPYKLELNVASNKYTKEGAEILLKELSKSGNSGYAEGNAFAKYNGITGINGKEAIFVDANGKQIAFPDFVPGSEKDFYIRFKPNNDGAISSTGNPIVNVSYLTKFVAGNFIKGVPKAIKFGDASSKDNIVSKTNLETTSTQILTKRNYAAIQTIKLDENASPMAIKLGESLGISTLSLETLAMRQLGINIQSPTSTTSKVQEIALKEESTSIVTAAIAQQYAAEITSRSLGSSTGNSGEGATNKPDELSPLEKEIVEGKKGVGDPKGDGQYVSLWEYIEAYRKKEEWDAYEAKQNKTANEPEPLSELDKDILEGRKKAGDEKSRLVDSNGREVVYKVTDKDVDIAREKQKKIDEYNNNKNSSNSSNNTSTSSKDNTSTSSKDNTPSSSRVHEPDSRLFNRVDYKGGTLRINAADKSISDKYGKINEKTLKNLVKALNYKPKTRDDFKGLTEGKDFFVINWAEGETKSVQKISDPIEGAVVTEDAPKKYPVWDVDDKGKKVKVAEDEYVEGITVKTTATYMITVKQSVPVAETGQLIPLTPRRFVVNIDIEKHIDLPAKTYKPGQGQAAFKDHSSEITDGLDKLKTVQDFANYSGEGTCSLQGNTASAGWEEAMGAEELGLNYLSEINNGSGNGNGSGSGSGSGSGGSSGGGSGVSGRQWK